MESSSPSLNSPNVEELGEPLLKYSRFKGSGISEILKRYSITAAAANQKMLILGSHLGSLHILDFTGEEVRRIGCHSAAINDLDIDATGEFVASCSDDGKVCITPLFGDSSMEFDCKKPVLSVALSPHFSSSKKFAYGGKNESLVVSYDGWFSRSETIIHQGEGPISCIRARWRGRLIAWANTVGVKVYEAHSHLRITFIPRPIDVSAVDTAPCSLWWENDTDLWISWGHHIQVCRISPSSTGDRFYGAIVMSTRLDLEIASIAALGTNHTIVIGILEKQNAMQPSERPEILAVRRGSTGRLDLLPSDVVSIREYQRATPRDYKVISIPSENTAFIIAPRDVLAVKLRDVDDRINWLKSRHRFEEAIQIASVERPSRTPELANAYLEALFHNGQYQEAANLSARILGADKELWEAWAFRFQECGHLLAILKHLPAHPRLRTSIYDMVLQELLEKKMYRELCFQLKAWSSGSLYSPQVITVALTEQLKHADGVSQSLVEECLAAIISQK